MQDTFSWLDIQRIAEELVDNQPDIDPLVIGFPDLMETVRKLDGFEEVPGHPCNERILEAIQQAWIEELEE
jgi:FeS assembly protein IscX